MTTKELLDEVRSLTALTPKEYQAKGAQGPRVIKALERLIRQRNLLAERLVETEEVFWDKPDTIRWRGNGEPITR